MTRNDRLTLLLKLTRHEPEGIDDLLVGLDPRCTTPGRDIAPCPEAAALPHCPLTRGDEIVIATRLAAPPEDPADVAFRLAALSLEQDLEVVVFSDGDYSGLERFGFRTDRIAGETEEERQASLDQLRQFWSVELII